METSRANPSDPGQLKQDSNHDHQSASAFMATAGMTISFITFTLVMLFYGLLLPRQGSAFSFQPSALAAPIPHAIRQIHP